MPIACGNSRRKHTLAAPRVQSHDRHVGAQDFRFRRQPGRHHRGHHLATVEMVLKTDRWPQESRRLLGAERCPRTPARRPTITDRCVVAFEPRALLGQRVLGEVTIHKSHVTSVDAKRVAQIPAEVNQACPETSQPRSKEGPRIQHARMEKRADRRADGWHATIRRGRTGSR